MDEITLPNGRVVAANRGIIGIDQNGDVFGGYDDEICAAALDSKGSAAWTGEDRIALADFMIARWAAYRIAALPSPPVAEETK